MSNDSIDQAGMNGGGRWSHTGAILTGGLSTRMGQAKHEMILPDGMTMFDKVIDVMSEVCSRVVVLAGDSEAVQLMGDGVELQIITDLRPNCGPLGGIEALLASGIDSEYLICPCDVPLISAEILRSLVLNRGEAFSEDEDTAEHVSMKANTIATAIKFENDDAAQSLPLRLSAATLDLVKQHLDEGRRAVHQLLKKIDVEEISLSENARPRIRNINTPEEFEEVCRLIGE